MNSSVKKESNFSTQQIHITNLAREEGDIYNVCCEWNYIIPFVTIRDLNFVYVQWTG